MLMSKLPASIGDNLSDDSRQVIVTDLLGGEVAHFGARLKTPFRRSEPSASELTVSWHNERVTWKMHNITSEVLGGQPTWETVCYASSLPCGWIPDTASHFLEMLILEAERGWILFLDQADEYLAQQVCSSTRTLYTMHVRVS